MARLPMILLLIIAGMDSLPRENHMITFIGMKDCPNTPPMRASLQQALYELGRNLPVAYLDLVQLAKEHDTRAGYGSPTILIDGVDLFGEDPSESLNPACRYYRDGVPDKFAIIGHMKSMMKSRR